MSSPRQTNTPLDPALARWLEPLRELTSSGADVTADSDHSELRGSSDAEQLRRAQHIQQLRTLIRNAPQVQTQTRHRSQWVWGFAAAAALMLAAGGTLFVQSQKPAVVAVNEAPSTNKANVRQLWGQVVARRAGGQTEVLGSGAAATAGDELSTTAEAYASLDVGRVRVDLSSATTLELVQTEARSQSYRLRAGRVDVSVPHVPSEKQHLEVVTPNAVVQVKGTVFSVEVDSQSGNPVTRVQVTRGSVGVTHNGAQQTVAAGQSWSSTNPSAQFVDQAEPEASVTPEDTPERAAGPLDAANLGAGVTSRAPVQERSSLREENQLFSRALQAQRRGNTRLANQLFSTLLRKYPDSPLAPSARTELEQSRDPAPRKSP